MHDPVIVESIELVKILATLIRKTAQKSAWKLAVGTWKLKLVRSLRELCHPDTLRNEIKELDAFP